MSSAYCMLKFSSLNVLPMERHERIAMAIAASGKKKGEIATECGVAASAVTQWISGESKALKPENLYSLAAATGFNAEWLAIGTGPERPGDDAGNVSLAAQPTRYYRYPVLSWVSAGLWGDALQPYEPGAEDQHELSDYKGKAPCFWLKVSGDSMTAPIGDSIPDGHLILVDTGMEARPGHLVIAKLESEDKATFKRLVQDGGRMFLKPLNPAYPLIEINGNCRFIGVVVETKRKLV